MDSHSGTPAPDDRRVTYVYDAENRLIAPGECDHGFETMTYTYSVESLAPSFAFVHDKQKWLFILKWPDGKTEYFRDSPARQLMVEPDPQTGEPRPFIKYYKHVYL
jgi:hypothetical protein